MTTHSDGRTLLRLTSREEPPPTPPSPSDVLYDPERVTTPKTSVLMTVDLLVIVAVIVAQVVAMLTLGHREKSNR